MMNQDRRHFLKALTASAAISSLPASFRVYGAPQDYNGKLLITIQAEGGIDVTSFTDPKVNAPIGYVINNWAGDRFGNGAQDIGEAGNIRYAPVAGNQAFFDKHYQDMMVINGIDAQTNSHTAGVTHNSSGRISAGYPSLTAVFSSIQAPDLPIAYINNGGYSETAGLIRYSRLSDIGQLGNVIRPNKPQWNPDDTYLHPTDYLRVRQAQNARLERLLAKSNNTFQQQQNIAGYKSALDSSSILTDFAVELRNAGDLQSDENEGDVYSSLKRQAQIALLAMKSGVSVSADLIQWGFDTHTDHDLLQYPALRFLTEGIDYLWEYAETLGLADRLVVVMTTDFGRTPHYNDTNGKDHWPIGSAIVMEKGASWGNKVVGVTDPYHNAMPIDTQSLQASDSGEIIYPKHMMYNLRKYLQLDSHVNSSVFPLGDAAHFDFFS